MLFVFTKSFLWCRLELLVKFSKKYEYQISENKEKHGKKKIKLNVLKFNIIKYYKIEESNKNNN